MIIDKMRSVSAVWRNKRKGNKLEEPGVSIVRCIPLLYGPITKCEIVASIVRKQLPVTSATPERAFFHSRVNYGTHNERRGA